MSYVVDTLGQIVQQPASPWFSPCPAPLCDFPVRSTSPPGSPKDRSATLAQRGRRSKEDGGMAQKID